MSFSKISREDYSKLISASFALRGNGSRMTKAIEKAGQEQVTIAFLGSSITAGYVPGKNIIEDSYPSLFCRSFSEKYCISGSCSCINAALSGSDSSLGLAFAEIEVRQAQPDIVFVEFAINNAMDKFYINSFESLIYKLLNFESEPAVISVIVCNRDFYTCSGYMEMVADHYDLPVVNIYKMITYGLENGLFSWDDYYCDSAHPFEEGHKLIADCIMELFEHCAEFGNGTYMPPTSPCFGRDFWSFEFLDHRTLIPKDCGRFEAADTIEAFPCGWSYSKNGPGIVFDFTVTCRSLFLIYEISNSNDYGEIEVYDAGKLICSIDGYSIFGWGNPDIQLVLEDLKPYLHRIQIKIRAGDENKKFFLLGFGIIR